MTNKLFTEKIIAFYNVKLTLLKLGTVLIDTYLNSEIEDLNLSTDTLIATDSTFRGERFGSSQYFIYKKEFGL